MRPAHDVAISRGDHARQFRTIGGLGSAREPLVSQPGRPVRSIAEAAALVFLVGLEVALEPFHMAVTLESEDVSRQTVEEEAVMADDHGAAGEVLDRVFK